ncbi:Uncharacterised protein [Raoultella terrigena]|uniref:Uncharacterized protein n=1 Tax=Raoultella terrigena TaxID=577 RepID=A0A4U9CWW8_RAOTE|nr:Uncharacterised protein [Raoultella terrigena]
MNALATILLILSLVMVVASQLIAATAPRLTQTA